MISQWGRHNDIITTGGGGLCTTELLQYCTVLLPYYNITLLFNCTTAVLQTIKGELSASEGRKRGNCISREQRWYGPEILPTTLEAKVTYCIGHIPENHPTWVNPLADKRSLSLSVSQSVSSACIISSWPYFSLLSYAWNKSAWRYYAWPSSAWLNCTWLSSELLNSSKFNCLWVYWGFLNCAWLNCAWLNCACSKLCLGRCTLQNCEGQNCGTKTVPG